MRDGIARALGPLFLLPLLLAACQKAPLHAYQPLGDDGWRWKDTLRFSLDDQEAGDYDIGLGLRLAPTFRYKSLWIVVETDLQSPWQCTRDTLEVELERPDGSLKGSGTRLLQCEVPASRLILHKGQSGLVKVYHITRPADLRDISDVGLHLTPHAQD